MDFISSGTIKIKKYKSSHSLTFCGSFFAYLLHFFVFFVFLCLFFLYFINLYIEFFSKLCYTVLCIDILQGEVCYEDDKHFRSRTRGCKA
jgi:hypothetical protein